MATETKTKHTPGALRAARAVFAEIACQMSPVFHPGETRTYDAEAVAAIIDRETAAPELLEALREMADHVRAQNENIGSEFLRLLVDKAEAALKKAGVL